MKNIDANWVRKLVLTLILFLFSDVALAARVEPVYTPLPIDLGKGFTRSEIHEAITDSLINSGWHEQASDGNRVRAFQAKGRHIGRIEITYSAAMVKFRHISSERMNEMDIDGIQHIHRLYNVWVHDFENALKFRINKLALERDRWGRKAPVTEVKVGPSERKRMIIKTPSEPSGRHISPDAEITTVTPVPENDAPIQGATVHEVIVKPSDGGKDELKEPAQLPSVERVEDGREKQVEIRPMAAPKEPDSIAEELPPVDAQPEKPVESRDLGELKW